MAMLMLSSKEQPLIATELVEISTSRVQVKFGDQKPCDVHRKHFTPEGTPKFLTENNVLDTNNWEIKDTNWSNRQIVMKQANAFGEKTVY